MKTRALLAAAALAVPAFPAAAGVIVQTDFESGTPTTPWTSNVRLDQSPALTRFMGRYSEVEGIAVIFDAPASPLGAGEHFRYTAQFDLYILDSWEGDAGGPDRFLVSENMHVLMDETFSNGAAGQSFRAPDVGPTQLGFGAAADSIYRNISLSFDGQAGEQIKIKWRGEVMQGLSDESWGIDNVKVTYEVVPSPGPLALLALGGVLMAKRTRNEK
jgi:hypothetical protein